MKKYVKLIIYIMGIIILCYGCSNYDNTYSTQAKVICINENSLQGNMSGDFLSSPNGDFGYINIIGIRITVDGKNKYIDFKSSNSELTYIKELINKNNFLPLTYKRYWKAGCYMYCLKFNYRTISTFRINR